VIVHAFEEGVMPVDFVLFLFSLVLCALSIVFARAMPIKLPYRLTNRQALPRRIGPSATRVPGRSMTAV
jgi:hypothetical protein